MNCGACRDCASGLRNQIVNLEHEVDAFKDIERQLSARIADLEGALAHTADNLIKARAEVERLRAER